MSKVFKGKDLKFTKMNMPLADFAWHTSQPFSRDSKSKHIQFDIRSLDPGKYSYPYHFHRAAEELFYVISGEATLRTPDGFSKIEIGTGVVFHWRRKCRR